MTLRSLLHVWARGGKNEGAIRGRERATPVLEPLEDRTAPARLTVTSAADAHQEGLLTLREAVALANADARNGQSDTIAFDDGLGSATITLTAGELRLSAASGGATETIDGSGRITLSGNNVSRVFHLDPFARAELLGLVITGGRGTEYGGGIWNEAGTLAVRGCTLSGNSTRNTGGGIFNGNMLTVEGSTFQGNTAGYGGAGIENQGSLAVRDSTFTGNSASIGGGIENEGTGTLTVSDSTFAGNSASVDGGGGIANYDDPATVNNCTFLGNSAYYGGGGILTFNGRMTVSNCTFAGNTANNGEGNGGGIVSYSVMPNSLTVSSSTFAGNSARFSGGAFTYGDPLSLNNSIVAGNMARVGPDVYGELGSRSSYNLIGDGTALSGIRDGTNHNRVGTAGAPVDPLLAPLGNYGGPTQTFALLPVSPALGAGGPSAALTAPVDDAATSLSVDYAAGLAVSPGLTIQIDSELLLITAVNATGNTFTVVRGVGGSAAAAHDAGAGLYAATDQRGAPRLVNGGLDIGAFQSQPAAWLVLSTSGPVSAGEAFTLTMTAYDAYGAVAIGYAGTVALSGTDPDAQLPPDYSFQPEDGGTHDFAVTLQASGSTVTLTVRDSAGNLAGSLDVVVG
jgi:hypothetical protein